MEEEMSRQQQQRDALNDKLARDVENEELKKNVKVRMHLVLWVKDIYFLKMFSSVFPQQSQLSNCQTVLFILEESGIML